MTTTRKLTPGAHGTLSLADGRRLVTRIVDVDAATVTLPSGEKVPVTAITRFTPRREINV